MHIMPVSNTNFKGGIVELKKINPKELHSYEAVQKIAEARDINISIAPYTRSKHFLQDAIYTVTVEKALPRKAGERFDKNKIASAYSYAEISKKACSEEASVKIYNAVINAIENLERKFPRKIKY